MNKPLFSIIIVNFNAKEFLKNCLNSILRNSFDNYEIIVVDNGSTDGSLQLVREEFRNQPEKIKAIALSRNLGPAAARNSGARVARGEYLGFLDNDTEVDKDWICAALRCFERSEKIAAIQCKLLFLFEKDRIDYAGEFLSNLGFLVAAIEHGAVDRGQNNFAEKILAAKSAGMFIKKSVFEQVGGFDEDYFIFMEETDLGWRCWLAGFEVVFCPDSVVYHYFSATKKIVDKNFNNYLVRFHGTKNYILTLYKNLSSFYLMKIMPIHIFLWLSLSSYLLLRRNFRSAFNIWKAIGWNIFNFRKNSCKRCIVQQKRVVCDKDLFLRFGLMKNRSINYFLNKFLQSQKEVITPENQ